jgi:hypothetical protein
MQKGDKNDDRKIATSVEIVDATPPIADNETISKSDVVSAGVTKLNHEDLHRLFQFRNLAYLILINTSETSAKNKHITNDKRIALSVVEQNNPFNMVSIKGRVVERATEGADEHLKRLAKKYLGIGKYYYRKPNQKQIILKIKPEKVMGLSIHPAFYFLAYSPWNK